MPVSRRVQELDHMMPADEATATRLARPQFATADQLTGRFPGEPALQPPRRRRRQAAPAHAPAGAGAVSAGITAAVPVPCPREPRHSRPALGISVNQSRSYGQGMRSWAPRLDAALPRQQNGRPPPQHVRRASRDCRTIRRDSLGGRSDSLLRAGQQAQGNLRSAPAVTGRRGSHSAEVASRVS